MASLYEERSAGMAEGEAVGFEKGRAEGVAIGMEKGRAEGIEKGKKEEKLNTAKMMNAEGIPVDTICKCTGLTAEQVKEL